MNHTLTNDTGHAMSTFPTAGPLLGKGFWPGYEVEFRIMSQLNHIEGPTKQCPDQCDCLQRFPEAPGTYL